MTVVRNRGRGWGSLRRARSCPWRVRTSTDGKRLKVAVPRPLRLIPQALPLNHRARVLGLLTRDRLADRATAQVYATLLDEGTLVHPLNPRDGPDPWGKPAGLAV